MIQNPLNSDNISVAESTRHQWDEEEKRLARDYDLQVRKLELDVMKMESRWASWMKIPLTILKLPVAIVLGLGYIVAMARKHEPGKDFWSILKW